jgi:hypothetical protein
MTRPLFSKNLKHSNKNYEIEFEAQEELLEFHGQLDDPTDIQNIIKRMDSGDGAAWFCAAVTVKLKGTNIEATEYLGGCSYKNYEDFIEKQDGYFAEMVSNATDELEVLIKEHKAILDKVAN